MIFKWSKRKVQNLEKFIPIENLVSSPSKGRKLYFKGVSHVAKRDTEGEKKSVLRVPQPGFTLVIGSKKNSV